MKHHNTADYAHQCTMKRKVTAFVKEQGGTTAWSGHANTMYINHPTDKKIASTIKGKVTKSFNDLPFETSTEVKPRKINMRQQSVRRLGYS